MQTVHIQLKQGDIRQKDRRQIIENDIPEVAKLFAPRRLELNLAKLRSVCGIICSNIRLDRLTTLVLAGKEQSWLGAAHLLRNAPFLFKIIFRDGAGCIHESDECRPFFTSNYPVLHKLEILSITQPAREGVPFSADNNLPSFLCRGTLPKLRELYFSDARALLLLQAWRLSSEQFMSKLTVDDLSDKVIEDLRRHRSPLRLRIEFGSWLPGLQHLNARYMQDKAMQLLPKSLQVLECAVPPATLGTLSSWVENHERSQNVEKIVIHRALAGKQSRDINAWNAYAWNAGVAAIRGVCQRRGITDLTISTM